MVCKNCGGALSEEDRFCPNCGAAVEASEQGAAEQKSENVCKNCGTALQEGALFCPHCGANVAGKEQGGANAGSAGAWRPAPPYTAPQYGQTPPAPQTVDAPSGGFFALGFFFPVIGLILFLVWKDQLPMRAKSCGKGALVGVIVWFVLGFVLGIIAGIAGASQYASAAAVMLLQG